MLPVWAEVILAWLALGTILNALMFGTKYMKFIGKIEKGKQYNDGYECATENIRMFCKTTGKFPSPEWIVSVKNQKIDNKNKIKASDAESQSNNKDLRSIYNYYFR